MIIQIGIFTDERDVTRHPLAEANRQNFLAVTGNVLDHVVKQRAGNCVPVINPV